MTRTTVYLGFVAFYILAIFFTWKMPHRIKKYNWHVVFGMLCILFAVPSIHIAFDQWLGLNNFAWLISYLCLVAICVFSIQKNKGLWIVEPPKYLSIVSGVVFGAFILIYSIWIINLPESAEHDYPRNIGDLLFMLTAYGYVVFILAVLISESRRNFLQLDKETHIKVRLLMNFIVYGFIIAGFGLKFVLTAILYVTDFASAGFFLSLSRILMLVGVAFSLLPLMVPPHGLVKIVGLNNYFVNWLNIIELRRLNKKVQRTYSVESPNYMNFWFSFIRPALAVESELLSLTDMSKQIQSKTGKQLFDNSVVISDRDKMIDFCRQLNKNL